MGMGELSNGIDGPGKLPHDGDDDATNEHPLEGGGSIKCFATPGNPSCYFPPKGN